MTRRALPVTAGHKTLVISKTRRWPVRLDGPDCFRPFDDGKVVNFMIFSVFSENHEIHEKGCYPTALTDKSDENR